MDPAPCGNCGLEGHRAAVCVKVGKAGWMETCCKCDSQTHQYEDCPHRKQEEDFEYLILSRGNKGPVKCSLHLGQVIELELGHYETLYTGDVEVFLPYSALYASQLVLLDPSYAEDWYYTGNHRMDALDAMHESARPCMPLHEAMSVLEDEFWTQAREHEITSNRNICERCTARGHSVNDCAFPCGFCGADDHQTNFCDIKGETCICCEYPGHLRNECDAGCQYCPTLPGLIVADHSVSSCPRLCHYCLSSDHKTGDCEALWVVAKRTCRLCPGERYHYPLSHLQCPVRGCNWLPDPDSSCEKHCQNCGWEFFLDTVLEKVGLTKHQCQWRRTLGPRKDDGEDNYTEAEVASITLICTKNTSHRQKAHKLSRQRMQAVLHAIANGNGALPVECSKCQEELADNIAQQPNVV